MGKEYTKEEKQFILENIHLSLKELSKYLNKSEMSIRRYIKKYYPEEKIIGFHESRWKDKDKVIRDNYYSMYVSKIAILIDEPVAQVQRRARKLGLKKFINNLASDNIRCIKCKETFEKTKDHFYLKKDNSLSSGATCKSCLSKYVRKSPWTVEATLKSLLKDLKANPQRKVKKGDLTDLDLNYLKELYEEQNGKCVLTGIIMNYKSHGQKDFNYISIDRIDSSRGYIKGNIQLSSMWANMAKNTLSNEEFKKYIDITFTFLNKTTNAKNINTKNSKYLSTSN